MPLRVMPLVLCEDCKGVEDALPEHEKRYAGRALECEKCEDIPEPIKEEEESEEKMESEFFDTPSLLVFVPRESFPI